MREVPRLDTMTLRCVPTKAGSVFVTWTNFGRVDFAITWAHNLQRMGIHNIFVGALDAESLQVRDLVMNQGFIAGSNAAPTTAATHLFTLGGFLQIGMELMSIQSASALPYSQTGIGQSRHSHICHVSGRGQRDGWQQR